MSRIKNIILFIAVFAIVAIVFFFGAFRSSDLQENFSGEIQDTSQPVSQPLFVALSAHPFVSDILARVGAPFIATKTISRISSQSFDGVDMFFVLDEREDGWAVNALRKKEGVHIFNLRDGRAKLVLDAPFLDTRRFNEEYYWLSLTEMEDVVRFVARSFAELDPVHAVQYLDNAYAYAYELQGISESYDELAKGASKKVFSTVGYGFTPLFTSYDVRFGSFIPFEGSVASSVEKAVESVRKRLASTSNAYVIADVTFPASEIKDLRLRERLLLLDPYGQLVSGDMYVDFIRDNMERLLYTYD